MDKIKTILALICSIVAWGLLLVGIATEYWLDAGLTHYGLFYDKGSNNPYPAAIQTIQAFYLIALFLLFVAVIFMILGLLKKTPSLPIENLGENCLHISNLFLFIADIVATVAVGFGFNGYSFRLAWAAFAINFLSSLLLMDECGISISCKPSGGAKSSVSPSSA